MKDENEEIDQMIKSALSRDEAVFYDNLKEQNLLEMVGGLFKGKLRWVHMMNILVTSLFVATAIYCLINFMRVEDTNELIRWGVGLIACMMATSMLKLWNWNQMNKNALLREIKRLQLLLASKH